MLEEGRMPIEDLPPETREQKLERLSNLLKSEEEFGEEDRKLRQKLFTLKQESVRRREQIFNVLDDLGLERGGVDWEARNG